MPVEIKIYGSGCAKCVRLAENARVAAQNMGLDVTITKITDTGAIVDAGVLRTPALGIGDEVKTMGKVASPEELERVLGGA
jgi:small redox-active disulfide protein 2